MNDGKPNKSNSGNSSASGKEPPDGGKGSSSAACPIFLESLSSTQGTFLAAFIANLLSEGLNPEQINILGNFIASVGALILYKAARDVSETEKDS